MPTCQRCGGAFRLRRNMPYECSFGHITCYECQRPPDVCSICRDEPKIKQGKVAVDVAVLCQLFLEGNKHGFLICQVLKRNRDRTPRIVKLILHKTNISHALGAALILDNVRKKGNLAIVGITTENRAQFARAMKASLTDPET